MIFKLRNGVIHSVGAVLGALVECADGSDCADDQAARMTAVCPRHRRYPSSGNTCCRELSNPLAALEAAGLTETLDAGDGPFTLFAPDDAAFAALEAANPGILCGPTP